MKREDIVKQLIPGVIVGIILGSVIGYLVGVDNQNVMKNNIGGFMACLIPCLLNCVIIVKGTAGVLKRKITIGGAFKIALPEIIIGALIGFFFHVVVLAGILNLDTCQFTRIGMTMINMILGVIVSTIMGYIVLKKYEKKVKYTRRKKA